MKDYLLLRYLEELGFTERFMSGYIRLNSLDFFWGEHDEPTKDGQIDSMEGLVCPIDATSIDDCARSDGYKYCNLLCCNRLNYIETDKSVEWCINNEMGKFGDYVVIIKDPDEFQKRLVAAANALEYCCLCHQVDYSDCIDETRDVFNKSPDYSYQNEWRAALYRGLEVCEPYELYIGPINDIAEWCYTEDLRNHLTRIFSEHDYRNTHLNSHGNISRSDLAKKMR